MSDADQTYTNRQISKCEHIDIMIRNPIDRFVSGVNEYCRQNSLDVKETWGLIKQKKLVDRHFAPQYIWLIHLYRFYKGTVTLKPFGSISEITQQHLRANESHQHVDPIEQFVNVDLDLIKDLHKTLLLGDIIRKYKNVLS
tara:strand:+ start:513 stop:935 length:423 start_codon:yes stop_codon:yes gene_type:complete